jgi:Zn-dependent membrane protease YugP
MLSSPIFLIGILTMVVGMIISGVLKSKFARYSKMPISSGLSGKEVAEKMLRDNGIYDVQVVSTEGMLTDNYNPLNKTINLSREVYDGRNTASAAVAAHETGHAVQHAVAYAPLKLRSALVPLQNASATIINIVVVASIFGGYFLLRAFPINTMLYLIIGAYGVMTLFSLITLPVEIDASRRGLAWIERTGVVNSAEHRQSKDALTWAAYTYVVAALGSLAILLYYISILNRRN